MRLAAIRGFMTLRVVLDTDVMVAGFSSPTGASRALLMAVLDGEVQMLLSTALLLEYEAVLTRPSVLAMSKLPAEEVLEALDELDRLCLRVAVDYQWRPLARDPDDDLVLEVAINGGAAVIASFNVADMQAGARRFGIPVERPNILLNRIKR